MDTQSRFKNTLLLLGSPAHSASARRSQHGFKEEFQTAFLVRSRMVLLFLLPKSSQQHLHSSARPSH